MSNWEEAAGQSRTCWEEGACCISAQGPITPTAVILAKGGAIQKWCYIHWHEPRFSVVSAWPGWRHECMMVSFLLLLAISVQKLRDFLIILREMVQQFEKMSFLKKLWKTPWSLCFLLLQLRLLCGHWCWGFIWVLWESYCSEECCDKSGAP